MPSSSHHQFVLCFFLLSFLCVNSQSSYVVILRNESPNNVVKEQCYVNDDIDPGEEILLNPGMSNHITTTFFPGKSNTLSCTLHLGEQFVVLFTLFDSDDTSICHIPSEECLWKIQEDGLCMFSQGKCVMFYWDTSLSIRHIASEPTKHITSDELKSEHIIRKKTP
ncbi:hypothetical protein AABB24_016242 [Solanum stoloniferum]|uniref:S-protein homolog n=1 Tax=Solanum stoloniferum TaxID=62892 RepID=A0ABD2TTL5_9SOLN